MMSLWIILLSSCISSLSLSLSAVCNTTLRQNNFLKSLLRKTGTGCFSHDELIKVRGFVICQMLRNFHNKNKFVYAMKISQNLTYHETSNHDQFMMRKSNL